MEKQQLIDTLYALCVQDLTEADYSAGMKEYAEEMTREDFCEEHLPNSEYMLGLLEQAGMPERADDYRKLFPEWIRGE